MLFREGGLDRSSIDRLDRLLYMYINLWRMYSFI